MLKRYPTDTPQNGFSEIKIRQCSKSDVMAEEVRAQHARSSYGSPGRKRRRVLVACARSGNFDPPTQDHLSAALVPNTPYILVKKFQQQKRPTVELRILRIAQRRATVRPFINLSREQDPVFYTSLRTKERQGAIARGIAQPGARSRIGPEGLINFNLDSAVLGSTFRGLVISDRFGFAKSLTGNPAALHTFLHNIIPNRHPPPIRKLQIVGLRPDVVRETR
jgi:hypothetical protein